MPADLVGLLVERAHPVDSCVVDHHPQRPVGLLSRVQERGKGLRIAHVQSGSDSPRAQLIGQRPGRLHVEVTYGHARTRARELPGNRLADSMCAAGHGDRDIAN